MPTVTALFPRVAAVLVVGVLLTLLSHGAATTQTVQWSALGSARTEDGGAWRFVVDVGQDLVGARLTVVRVTSAACTTAPDQAVVLEAQLQPTQAGNMSWEGKLTPMGAPALALSSLEPNSGDVLFVPTANATRIDTALDGVTPGTVFSVCVRQP